MSAISVVPAQVEDAPVLAAIASDSSESDAQTEMKGYGRAPFDISEYTRTSVPQHLKSPRIRTIKAVDEETGAIMGEVPPASKPPAVENDKSETPAPSVVEKPDDPVARLVALTDADLKDWMDTVMPPGASCLYVVTLYVAPAFQRRGVGSALLKWGTDLAEAGDTLRGCTRRPGRGGHRQDAGGRFG
ncbi:hypothetical protein B0T25DRAFT_611406 [Lasiosphaeria hispida]|uniref:N-acetyltransferase domain-containing protein n=1 Tax=Lasiosphaeria hispida TaxID=260671 RepID=A0AAJ0MD64_9PEZI|nr:hypothetical protein B0T25DRAFT_611406 [Lasiosphaeria hispida]